MSKLGIRVVMPVAVAMCIMCIMIGVVSAATADVAAGSIATADVAAGSIATADIAAGSVATADIAASTTPKTLPQAPQAGWAKRVIGVVTGVIVGTPICAARKPFDEEKYGVSQMTGDNPPPRTAIPAAVFWAPFAAVSGLLEAPFFAINNSLVHYAKPFSKQQFSFVDEPVEDIKMQGTSER